MTCIQNALKWQHFKIPHLELGIALDVQLHGFSDATEHNCYTVEHGYYTVVDPQNVVKNHILIAKSKVAPLKRISLPCLQLCGTHLLTKLKYYCITFVQTHHKMILYIVGVIQV